MIAGSRDMAATRLMSLFAAMALLTACDGEERIQSVLHPGGGDAAVIAEIAWVLFIGGTLIFVGMMVLLVMSLRDNRRKVRVAKRSGVEIDG